MAFWQMRKNTTLCEDHYSPETDMMIAVFKDGTVEAYKGGLCYRFIPSTAKPDDGWKMFLAGFEKLEGMTSHGTRDECCEVHCDEMHE